MQESLRFALQNIRANILRTLLSLIGVTIGVFCIISILTLIDSMEYTIKGSLSRFGSNVFFVQKWPWGFDSDYPWWKYVNRPQLKYQEMVQLQKRLADAEAVAFMVRMRGNKITAGKYSAENVTLQGISHEYDKAMEIKTVTGRYFTEDESQRGDNVILLGYDLATALYGGNMQKAVGQELKTFNRTLHVVGVLEKQGNGLGMGDQEDNGAIVPINFIRKLGSSDEDQFGPTILIKGPDNIDSDIYEDELRGVLRSVRKLHPREEDNFAINRISMLTAFLTNIFGKINLYGWVIAAFSILVGGFGIANIMFVSVKERTPIIGIQKSLGAKNYFILVQFLAEAVLLCVLGGLIGLLLIFLLSSLLNLVSPLKLILTLKNVMVGIGISSLIGIISGFLPSRQAAKMDPIEAIRSNG
jgi:putative ABC transport system permease protein